MSEATPVSLTAVAGAARLGLKGPRAAAWLEERAVTVPPAPNRWCDYACGVCLRLGVGEFFVEGTAEVERLAVDLAPQAGVYPVLRQDAALLLGGAGVGAVLEQSCAVDFTAASLGDDAVVLTSMLGVGVQVIWRRDAAGRAYQLWCDASFGPYFTAALAGIVRELGGTVSLNESGREGVSHR